MKILILGNMSDGQTGLYIAGACKKHASTVTAIDTRAILKECGTANSQKVIMDELNDLNMIPDLIIVMKGLELTLPTLKNIRAKFPKAKLINWFFDVYLGNKKIWKFPEAFEFIRIFDYFFCSLKGVADKMQEVGLTNAYYLDEACSPEFHGATYINYFQQKKYGEDIAFIGSLGFHQMHVKRIEIIEKILKEGFKMKVWGALIGEKQNIPKIIKDSHMNAEIINQQHSMIVQSSFVNLGIDQDNDIELGHSARLYRIMCAGGLYLCGAVKGLEKMFKINAPGEEIKPEQELVVYYDNEDLIKKLDFLLENITISERIAMNGQKVVLEKHTFSDRIDEMIKTIEVKDKMAKKGDCGGNPRVGKKGDTKPSRRVGGGAGRRVGGGAGRGLGRGRR